MMLSNKLQELFIKYILKGLVEYYVFRYDQDTMLLQGEGKLRLIGRRKKWKKSSIKSRTEWDILL
jgi:hypothetical protein